MSSTVWLILCAIGLGLLTWIAKNEARDLFVFTAFCKPRLFRYLPFVYNRASQIFLQDAQGYIERHPVRIVHNLAAIVNGPNDKLRNKAMQVIVDNIKLVAQYSESEAAKALLTVINKSDSSCMTHHQALILRPSIIDGIAESDPMQAVLLAQKGIAADQAGEPLYAQSCELALRHLDHAFNVEPIMAAHAACTIARKSGGETRDSAIWMLLSHMNRITEADFESGHAAAEQAALLATLDTPLHASAISMWEWHMQSILQKNPSELVSKIFYGFGISTASGSNKWDLYERGFGFLLQNPSIIRAHSPDILRVSLSIGLRANQTQALCQKSMEVWTAALKELCEQDLRSAIRAANEAMTFTAPGSLFERHAQTAYCHLKRLDDEITSQIQSKDVQPVFS